VWRYWLDTWAEYQVVFEPGGTVKNIVADPATLNRVSLP
jgi:hypothetical protein